MKKTAGLEVNNRLGNQLWKVHTSDRFGLFLLQKM